MRCFDRKDGGSMTDFGPAQSTKKVNSENSQRLSCLNLTPRKKSVDLLEKVFFFSVSVEPKTFSIHPSNFKCFSLSLSVQNGLLSALYILSACAPIQGLTYSSSYHFINMLLRGCTEPDFHVQHVNSESALFLLCKHKD